MQTTFDDEMKSILDTRPHISTSKINSLIKLAIKNIRHYKTIVQSIHGFLETCDKSYKVSGIYVIDAIAKAIAKQQSKDADSFISLLESRLDAMFAVLNKLEPKDTARVEKVLSLWKKGEIFSHAIIENIEQKYFRDSKEIHTYTHNTIRVVTSDNPNSNSHTFQTNTLTSIKDPRINENSGTTTHSIPTESMTLINSLTTLIAIQQQNPTLENLTAITTLLPILEQCKATTTADLAIVAQLKSIIDTGALNPPPLPIVVPVASETYFPPKLTSFSNQYQDDYRNDNAINSYNYSTYDKPQNDYRDNSPSRYDDRRDTQTYSDRNRDKSYQNRDNNDYTDYNDHNKKYDDNQTRGFSHKNSSNRNSFQDENFSSQNQNSARPGNSRMQNMNSNTNKNDIPAHIANLPGPLSEPAYFDSSIPEGCIRVKSRTIYVGGVTGLITPEKLRELFETCGRVETVQINYPKFNAFIKLFTRKEAEAAQQTLGNATIEGVQLQLKWAAGFGNKQQFDFTVGESILRINEMKEQEKRWVQTTARGGGPLETGMAMEEPDVQIGSKIDSTFGDPNLTKNDPRSSGGFRGGFRSEQVYGGDFNQRNQRGNEFNQTKSFQQQNGLQGQHQYQGNFEGHGNQNRMPNTTNQQQSRFQDFSPQNLNTLDNYRPNNINSTINPDAMIINDDFKDEVNKLVGDAARVLSPMIPNLLIPPQSVVNVIKPVYDTSGFPPGAASMMGFPPSAASMNRANQEDESVAKRTRMM